nr:MAG TPA: protein of unknown function (DUF4376) [Caudoviricetes sp.]
MQTKYKYKDKTYTHIYPLSEALGQEGVFIPLSISEETLCKLGVEVTCEEEPIEYFKNRRIEILKMQRDKAEVEPITYQGYSFDYDEKARDRINAAIIALELQGANADIAWTTADNQDVSVTAADLRAIVGAVSVRSNLLHVAYRKAKARVEAAGSADEVNAVCME